MPLVISSDNRKNAPTEAIDKTTSKTALTYLFLIFKMKKNGKPKTTPIKKKTKKM
jgi:hypothetical protein